MMLSCEQASKLLSEAQERPLKLTERAGLTMHLAMCHGCREFGRQVSSLRDLIRRSEDHDDTQGK